jgi:hypothetical protein
LTGIVQDNKVALKRLISMMSHLLDNNVIAISNHTTNTNSNHSHTIDKEKQRVETISHLNHGKLILSTLKT